MRKKLLGVGMATLIMTLVAPFAVADESEPPVEPPVTQPAPAPEPKPAPEPAPQPKPAPPTDAEVARDWAASLAPEQAIYMVPGHHLVNGRYWRTQCSMYSSNIARCQTDIFGSTVFQQSGRWFTQNNWVFNNLTYLPSDRSAWSSNALGGYGVVGGDATRATWTAADKRAWRTECDTSATGRGACRNYATASVATVANNKVTQTNREVFNGIVRFTGGATPWIKTIPPALTTTPAGIPQPSTPQPVITHPTTQQGFRLDQRCMTGRTFCVSKGQNKMAWVVDGKIQQVVDVRFGKTATPTRNGSFKIYWKSRDHFSSIYKVPMPYSLFFDGGIAIHYSADFARRGYSGGSGGCVNVRDYNQMKSFFNTARVGDKVIVYN